MIAQKKNFVQIWKEEKALQQKNKGGECISGMFYSVKNLYARTHSPLYSFIKSESTLSDLLNAESVQWISVESVGFPGSCVPFLTCADDFYGRDYFVIRHKYLFAESAVIKPSVRADGEFHLAHLNAFLKNFNRVSARIFIGVKSVLIIIVVKAAAVGVAQIAELKIPELPVMKVFGKMT
jgi:hypothetical protein